jgi:hypothetical protein
MARAKPKPKAKPAKSIAKAKSKARPANSARKSAKAKSPARPSRARARPKQKFTVSHHREADFAQGLRAYAKYRDLGVASATGGMARAHVIRFVPPFRPEEASTPHYHDLDFQMIYVLRGWYKTEFKGEGVHTLEAGSCWIQPPRVKHAVLGYSDDCELLEIVLPADFKTVTLATL